MSKFSKSKKILTGWNLTEELQNSSMQIKPILQIIRLSGAFPYRTCFNGVKTRGIWQYLWVATHVTLITVAVVLHITNMPAWKFTRENIIAVKGLRMIYIIRYCLFYAAMIFDHLNFFCRYDATISFFKKLEGYDEDVCRLGHPRRQSVRVYWISTIICALSCLAGISLPVIKDFQIGVTRSASLVKFVQRLLEFFHPFFMLKWVVYVFMIHQRFEHLNSTIVSNLSSRTSPFSREAVTTRSVLFLHANLVQIIGIFNRLVASSMLLSFAALLLNVLLTSWSIMSTNESLLNNYSMFSSFVEMFVICYVCTLAENEANDIGRCLTNFQRTLNDSSNIEDKIILAMQVFHNRVAFSGGDFFDVNLLTFRGLVVMYFTFIAVIAGEDKPEDTTAKNPY